jgi:ubiquinone/menaquinone biosynthesis C-methylase UbiE
MTHSDGRVPPFGQAPSSWDDWDPNDAHRGYTGKMGALGGLDLGTPFPGLDLPSPVHRAPAEEGLSPAGLAASARAAAEDYLTIEYAVDDPGFVELYDAVIVPQWSIPFGRLLLSVFLTQTRNTGWQVLDVACATGYPTIELARFLGQDCDVAGLDPWEAAIRLARHKAAEEWLRNVTFVVGDVLHNNLPDGTFDTITCNLGLPSFSDRRAALGAIARLLRPGGSLLLTTPLQSAMREFLDTYYLTLRDLKLTDYLQALSRLVGARPTVASARALVEGAGFEVERTVTDSFTLRFPDARAFLTSPVVHTNFMHAWRAIVPDLTVRRLVFNEVERRLQARAAANNGALEMTVPMLCAVARRL